MRILNLIVIAGIAGLAMPALAGSGECGGAKNVVQHIFDSADSNGDGSLTPDEYDAAGLQSYGVPFAAYDTNEDGLTSWDEYLALYERHHAPEGSIGT